MCVAAALFLQNDKTVTDDWCAADDAHCCCSWLAALERSVVASGRVICGCVTECRQEVLGAGRGAKRLGSALVNEPEFCIQVGVALLNDPAALVPGAVGLGLRKEAALCQLQLCPRCLLCCLARGQGGLKGLPAIIPERVHIRVLLQDAGSYVQVQLVVVPSRLGLQHLSYCTIQLLCLHSCPVSPREHIQLVAETMVGVESTFAFAFLVVSASASKPGGSRGRPCISATDGSADKRRKRELLAKTRVASPRMRALQPAVRLVLRNDTTRADHRDVQAFGDGYTGFMISFRDAECFVVSKGAQFI